MNSKYDKIKGSAHYFQNITLGRPGHNVPLWEVEVALSSPLGQAVQPDGRERYWADCNQGLSRIVVSAAVSAGYSIGRVVTVCRDRERNIGKP